MAEFGHFGHIGGGLCIDAWGAGPFVIEAAGKSYRFEDSDRFGPALISKRGDVLRNPYPPQKSPFWRAHFLWVKQGRKIEDGLCVWREPKPNLLQRIGRHAIVVERGEEHGLDIFITPKGTGS
jgi:hypothetical protein